MYTLCSEIQVAGMRFSSVNEVKINRSIHTPGATAVIKVPVTAVLRQKDETATAIETAQAVKVGDVVTIRLGYNGTYNDEFRGYVRRLNYRTPLEIECEDAFFLARQKSVTLSGTMTLSGCLSRCGLGVLHATALTLKNFVADNRPVSWVLGKLKTDYGLSIFFDMQGRVVAGRAFDVVSSRVNYTLRENVINDNDLRYQLASDVKLKVKAVCFKKDGTKVEAEIGAEGGIQRTLHFYDVESLPELKSLAEAELKRYSRDGYEGKIETFLFPYAEPCQVAAISDRVYPERDGNYYIESTETTFGTGGARRLVTVGMKIG